VVSMVTVNDGLSQGMVSDILQSRDGFIWMATKDGLNRYDGFSFEVFSPDPFDPYAIGGSEVQSLFEDRQGWLWISLIDGMDVFDPRSGRFFHLNIKDKPINFQSITESSDGSIWLLNDQEILKSESLKDQMARARKLGSSSLEFKYQSIPLANVKGPDDLPLIPTQLHFNKENKLLIGTNHGLYSLDLKTNQVVQEHPIGDYSVIGFTESNSADLLVLTREADRYAWVLISNSKTHQKIYKEFNSINNFHSFDENGYLWAIHHNELHKWKLLDFINNGKPLAEFKLNLKGLEKNPGYGNKSMMVQKGGIIWIGTSGFGIIKVVENGKKFRQLSPGTATRYLYEDANGGIYFMASQYKKLLSRNFDQELQNAELPFTGNQGISFDSKGNLWWLNENQLYFMDASNKQIRTFPFKGFGLICDRKGHLISLTEKGLNQFDPTTQSSQHFPFEQAQKQLIEDSYWLYEDGDGTIWIHGLEGLTKARQTGSGFEYQQYINRPSDRNSLSNNRVLSVVDDPMDPQRYLWVGTKGGGLNRFDKKSLQFKKIGTEDGLPDMVIYGLLTEAPGKPYIWLSSNKGLCRFDVQKEIPKNFTISDGLQDNEFNAACYLKTHDGYLLFGGVNGVNVFHPDSLKFNQNIPQISIVRLKVNNKKYDIWAKEKITLRHDQNLLNFDFAALEYTNPFQNQYRYKLENVDKDWVSLGHQHSIQFANLAPGEYTFKVMGSNNDGKWSHEHAAMMFTILPPWWASWWAYIIYCSLVFTACWIIYKYQLQRKIALQEANRLREMDEFKYKFFTNITHEFRTPLTVIQGMTDQLAKSEKENTKLGKLGLIKRNSENLMLLINQILDLAKLESKTLKINYIQGDVLTFLKYITESLHSLANAQNLMLRVQSDQPAIMMDYDPERLMQIVHNLLSNAVKFTPSGGKVLLEASIKDNKLHLIVTDSGRGIPEAELPFLFDRFFQAKNQEYVKAGGTGIGLSLTKEIVKALGGEISVESVLEKGSSFKVILPITNKAAFANADPKLGMGAWDSGIIKQDESGIMDQPLDLNLPQILLIEDNPDVVEYLSACLKGKYSLDFAFNGRAGIENALVQIPDLIISDVMMPEKDGFEVVDTLKNNELTSHVPIILLTAKADMDSKLTGLRRGADAYLFKPFYQEELLVTIHNLLESRRKLQLKYQEQLLIKDGASPSIENSETEDAFLLKFRALVEKHISDSDFEMLHIERGLSMSRSQIYRKIKALTDKSPSLLIRSIRLHHGRHLLLTTQLTVSEIAYQVGYSGINNFSDAYLDEFGERPMKTRGS